MITYQHTSKQETKVLLNNKHVGKIISSSAGYQYFPKGKKTGGEIFPTIKQVKESLEG